MSVFWFSQLESLRQSAELAKDSDNSVLLANTYNEESSPRFSKNETNARRRKLPPKKGNENMGYLKDGDEERQTSSSSKETKKKKRKQNLNPEGEE